MFPEQLQNLNISSLYRCLKDLSRKPEDQWYSGVERQVWYHGWEVPSMLLLGFTYEKHSEARPTRKIYYTTTRVVRHCHVKRLWLNNYGAYSSFITYLLTYRNWRTAITQDITLNWACGGWLVSTLLQALACNNLNDPYPFPFWVIAEQKGNEIRRLLYCCPSLIRRRDMLQLTAEVLTGCRLVARCTNDIDGL